VYIVSVVIIVIRYQDAESDGDSFADAERNERAVEQYGDATDILDRARGKLDSVEDAHAAIDAEAFDAPDPALEDPGGYTLYVEIEGKEATDAQERIIDGKARLNQYFVELDAGFEQLEAETFIEARSLYGVSTEPRCGVE